MAGGQGQDQVLIGLTPSQRPDRRRVSAAGLFFSAASWPSMGAGFAATAWVRRDRRAADLHRGHPSCLPLRGEDAAPRNAGRRRRLLDRLIADAEIVTADEATAPLMGADRPVESKPPGAASSMTRARRADRARRTQERAAHALGRNARVRSRSDVRRALAEANEAGVGRREISAAKQANLKLGAGRALRRRSARYDRALRKPSRRGACRPSCTAGSTSLHARFGDPKNCCRAGGRWSTTRSRESRQSGSTAIVVDKLKRRLYVYSAGKRVAAYEAELGAKGLRQKVHSGDQATPEGTLPGVAGQERGAHQVLQGAADRLSERRGPRALRLRQAQPARCRCAPASAA